jgi:hypothetical protein
VRYRIRRATHLDAVDSGRDGRRDHPRRCTVVA